MLNSCKSISIALEVTSNLNTTKRRAYCGGAPRRLLNSVDFGGFQRFSASATRDWNGGIIAGFL
jgi:hypothetical protein